MLDGLNQEKYAPQNPQVEEKEELTMMNPFLSTLKKQNMFHISVALNNKFSVSGFTHPKE